MDTPDTANDHPELYLASASPRRRELLAAIGIRFHRLALAVDETPLPSETADAYVSRLALAKARAGWRALTAAQPARPVLGADTAVVIDGEVLGKPRDRDHALQMLAQLSDREHQVLSAVALVQDQHEASVLSTNRVRFRALSDDERSIYWDTGEPADKAGAYGVQGLGSTFVSELHGSHSGVMGLPLFETAQLLHEFGINSLTPQRAHACRGRGRA